MSYTKSLTKRTFLSALDCRAQAWFYRHGIDEGELSQADQFRIETGVEIGKMARSIYPDGFMIDEGSNELNHKKTMDLLQHNGDLTLFEATFLHENGVARADILQRQGDKWQLIEVKSSLDVKDEFIDDLAYTTMLAIHAGVELADISLMLVSRDYRLGMSNEKLFNLLDCTEPVMEKVKAFQAVFTEIDSQTASNTQPTTQLIWACKDCEFFKGGCIGRTMTHPVFEIPNIRQNKFEGFVNEGCLEVHQLPATVKLTYKQRVVWEAVQAERPIVDKVTLQNLLNSVNYPVYYLDFESVSTAIPLYDDIAPYQEIVTQYSIHKYSSISAEQAYTSYLADHRQDDRRMLAERLLEDIGEHGSIMVYHAGAERRFINSLAKALPDLAGRLNNLIDRLVDLKEFLIKAYYHPSFHGSYSIKKVLPVLVPELSYDSLDVGNGQDASAVFAMLAQGKFSDREVDLQRKHLLEYCEQDTLAMVKIHQKLCSMV